MGRKSLLQRIGLFHIHIADKAGFCLICNFLSKPERQMQLEAFDFEYDDPLGAWEYEWNILKNWNYSYYIRRQLLGRRREVE
ncbi:hypothetical protein LCGC14_1389800 [marine sediment metagenome]|uniref:Uncharacterized protein n=1 Tax=marine sediment metagenome TaxID=412755 RepID=A0A0F9KL37_9ZZZZ